MSVYKLYTSAKNIIYCFNLGSTVFVFDWFRFHLYALCTPANVYSLVLYSYASIVADCRTIVIRSFCKRQQSKAPGLFESGFSKSILFQWCRIYMLLTTINDQTIKGNSIVTVYIRQIVLCYCFSISNLIRMLDSYKFARRHWQIVKILIGSINYT